MYIDLRVNREQMAHTQEVQLVFKVDEFFRWSKSGAIWGTIYFENSEGMAFPDKGWTDIVAGFLRAWLNALVRMADGISSTESVAFYDGPMDVELSTSGGGIVQLVFLRREVPQFAAEQNMAHLLSSSVTLAETLLKACEEHGWQNADTVAVTSSLKNCKSLVSGLSPKPLTGE